MSHVAMKTIIRKHVKELSLNKVLAEVDNMIPTTTGCRNQGQVPQWVQNDFVCQVNPWKQRKNDSCSVWFRSVLIACPRCTQWFFASLKVLVKQECNTHFNLMCLQRFHSPVITPDPQNVLAFSHDGKLSCNLLWPLERDSASFGLLLVCSCLM